MDILGTIGYRTEVDPSGIAAGVKQAEASVQAAMRRIDAMEATAKLQAEDRELQRKVNEAKREILELDKMKADPDIELDDEQFKKDYAAAKLMLKDLQQQKVEVGYSFSEAQRSRRELEKTVQTQQKLLDAQQKGVKAGQDAVIQTKKQAAELQRLRTHYVRLGDQVEALQRKVRKNPFRPDAADRLAFDRLGAEIDHTAARIRALGGDTNDLDIDLERQVSVLRRWGSSLAQVRVHAGIMSLTVRQLGIGIITLGPYIFAVMGALSTLIGALGAGIAGAAGLAAAGLAGAALGFIGIKSAVAPAMESISEARAEFEAVHDATRRYGEGSDQAKAAQDKLNKTLKQMSPAARSAAEDLWEISDSWERLTKPTQQSFFELMADGLGRAKTLMPAFAKQTNDMADGLAEAGDNFLRAFDAGEMRSAMQGVMQPLTAALPTLGTAMGNIAEGLGNIFTSFGRHFGTVASGIESWSRSFVKATQDTGSLNDTVDGLVESAESLVHLAAAGGRVLTTFFGTGRDEGTDWINDMTEGLDDLNRSMQSMKGQEGLNAFFGDSVAKTKDLADIFGGMGESIFQIAEMFGPAASTAANFLNVVTDIVTAISDLAVVGPIANTALAGFLLSRFPVIGGVMQKGFQSLGTTLTGRGGVAPGLVATTAATRALSTATVTNTGQIRYANGQYGPMATNTQKLAARMGALGGMTLTAGGAIGRTAGLLGTLGSRALGVLGPVGMVASIGFIMADSFGLFGDGAEEATVSYDDWVSSLKQSGGDMRTVNGDILSLIAMAEQLGPALQKGGREGMIAMQQLRTTLAPAQQRLNELRTTTRDAWDARGPSEYAHLMDQNVTVTQDMVDNLNAMGKEGDRALAWLGDDVQFGKFLDQMDVQLPGLEDSIRRNGQVTQQWRQRLLDLGASSDSINALNFALDPYQKNLEKTARAQAVLSLQLTDMWRAQQGMELLGPRALQSIQPLIDAFGKKRVARWSIQVDDSRAQRDLLDVANKLTGLGRKKAVLNIMASDASARQKIEALQRLLDNIQNRKRQVQVSADTGRALANIDQLIARAEAAVQKPRTLKILADAGDALKGIADVTGKDIPEKTARVGADVASAVGGIISVVGALAQVQSKTVTITVVYRTVGSPPGARAEGGPLAGPGYPVPGYANGGKITKPQFLVGEEAPRHPEFVIATNPAYRKANVGYLTAAARALGMEAFKKGGVPTKYQIGSIPAGPVESKYNAAKSKFQQAKQDLHYAQQAKKQAKGAKEKRKAEKKIDKAQRDKKQAKKAYERWDANWSALRRVNANIDKTQAMIDRDASMMDLANTNGNTAMFNKWRDRRGNHIDALIGKLTLALKGRHGKGAATGKFAIELQDRIAQLKAERNRMGVEQPSDEGGLTAAEAKQLALLERDKAVAATTAGGEDDVTAQQGLVSFWQGVLDRLQANPKSTPASIQHAAEELLAAQGGGSGGGGTGSIVSQGDIFSTARQDLYRQFGSNTLMGASVSPFQGSGPGGVAITNNFSEPPPDPHTWSRQQAFEIGTLGV